MTKRNNTYKAQRERLQKRLQEYTTYKYPEQPPSTWAVKIRKLLNIFCYQVKTRRKIKMGINQKKHSDTVVAVVRASRANSRKHNTKISGKYKHKFNRHLLPPPSDFYSKELKKFHPRKIQATALCPFHNERHPSFSVDLKSGAFFCFSCGMSGGDIIDFYKKRYGIDFIAACKALGVWHE